MESFFFYSCSALAILSALGVIFLSQPVRALLSLIITMFSLSVLYLLLGADFVAMVNLIVYAGAVLVLFLFVIMLQGTGAKDIPFWERFPLPHILGSLTAGAVFLLAIFRVLGSAVFEKRTGLEGSAEAIGRTLFSSHLLHFELTSLLLMLGLLAGIALAKKDKEILS